jgi:hypothetical protein
MRATCGFIYKEKVKKNQQLTPVFATLDKRLRYLGLKNQ